MSKKEKRHPALALAPLTTEEVADAAICVYEALMEDDEWKQIADKYRANHGSAQFRQAIVALADGACLAWNGLCAQDRQPDVPFDFEFVPSFLKHMCCINEDEMVTYTPLDTKSQDLLLEHLAFMLDLDVAMSIARQNLRAIRNGEMNLLRQIDVKAPRP